MASAVTSIQDLRVSFIWFEPQLCLFDDQSTSATRPFSFLGHSDTYQRQFDLARQQADPSNHLTLPWRDHTTSHFWSYYLGGIPLENVNAVQAWKAFVPLRGPVPWTIKKPSWLSAQSHLHVEAFFYAHGIALVVTVVCKDDFASLNQAVEMAFQVRMNGNFEVEAPQHVQGSYPLNILASNALELLHDQAWGAQAPRNSATNPPYSILTVVRGNMDVASVQQLPDNETHKALEGLTSWSRTYQYDMPTPFKDANLLDIRKAASVSQPGRNPAPSHVLYATKKGRAVWFPASFMQVGKSSLGCYHRNLVMVTMQMESLCQFVSLLAGHINQFYFSQPDYLDRALNAVGRLYGRTDKTYQTWSARAQLDLNGGQLNAVNVVRAYRNKSPLH